MSAIKEAIEQFEQEKQDNNIAKQSLIEHVAQEQNLEVVTEEIAAQYLTEMTFQDPALSSEGLFELAKKLAE